MKKILSIDQGELKEIDRTIMRIIDELPMIEWHVSNCMNEDVLREMDYFSTILSMATVLKHLLQRYLNLIENGGFY